MILLGTAHAVLELLAQGAGGLGGRDGLTAAQRSRIITEALVARWSETPPKDPIIIAGSTGSRGLTAALMRGYVPQRHRLPLIRSRISSPDISIFPSRSSLASLGQSLASSSSMAVAEQI